MTPSARVQAAIELLDVIITAAREKGAPADRLVADYFRTRRYAGSGDRRTVRDLVYRAVRLCGPVPDSGRAAMVALVRQDPELAKLFDGSTHGPAPLSETDVPAPTGIAPAWLVEQLIASGLDRTAQAALLERAPLDIRVNALKADRNTIELPEPGEPLAAPHGMRLPAGTQVQDWAAWRGGMIEVQDHASQWVCEAVGAQAGQTIIDLCAGAGGKTLALAAATDDAATIVACDTDARRLGNLAPRAARADARIAHTMLLDPGREMNVLSAWVGKADRALIDAPCSGSGTWRRNPESRWRLDQRELDRMNALQDRVLDIGARLVRPGGQMTFATCSVLDAEGPDRVAAFLTRNAGWQAHVPDLPVGAERRNGRRMTPCHDGTDGFFVANLTPPC